MNAKSLLDRIISDPPGSKIIYHAGFLAIDAEATRDADIRRDIAWKVGDPSHWGLDAAHLLQTKLVEPRMSDDGRCLQAGVYEYALQMRRRLSPEEANSLRKIAERTPLELQIA